MDVGDGGGGEMGSGNPMKITTNMGNCLNIYLFGKEIHQEK